MEIFKIGFTGTQRGMNSHQISEVENFLKYIKNHITIEAHHGDCIGADFQFHNICTKLGILTVSHPPLNQSKRAKCKADIILPMKEYIDRNHDIVNVSEIIIAAPFENSMVNRSGTWATIRYAEKLNKFTYIIYPKQTELKLD